MVAENQEASVKSRRKLAEVTKGISFFYWPHSKMPDDAAGQKCPPVRLSQSPLRARQQAGSRLWVLGCAD
jgi:hypothetical protein